MKIEQLIKKFNQPDVQLVVSGWPERKSGKHGHHGDAAFTRETLLSLVKQKGMRFVVIAETNHDNRPQVIANGNILILRVIDHGKFHLYPTILTWLNKFPAIKHVTVHSNFTYSGMRHFVLLVPFLTLIRLTGRKVSLIAHNVLESVDFLAKQLNLENKAIITFLNLGVKFYNIALGKIVNHVVVLDIGGKQILEKYVPAEKLVYNPHWVKPRTTQWSKKAAKKKLGIAQDTNVILSFGFISYYKGSDVLADLFTKAGGKKKKYHLIFAGGKSPSLSQTKHYQTYYQKFEKMVESHPNITLTGFLPDNQVGLYFAAADLVVLPYRGLMGGSGAFAYAVGYEKPFIVSAPMVKLLENPDIAGALDSASLRKQDLMFGLHTNGVKQIMATVTNKASIKTLTRFSKQVRNIRNIDTITDHMYDELYKQDYALNPDTILLPLKPAPAFK